MARWWPDAPELPEILENDWHLTGIVATVKDTGAADWGIGRGEAYDQNNPERPVGPCKVWMHTDTPGDIVENWGWLDGTHYRQLCPVFELVDAGENGNGEETGNLERIADALEALVVIFNTRL